MTPFRISLYADLNLTLTDAHLGMRMLEYLDPKIAEKAKKIMSEYDRSKRSRVLSVARMINGKTIDQLHEASEKAVKDVNIAGYIANDLKTLKPTILVIWTDTPRLTVETFRKLKLDPVYNSSGKYIFIKIYATELQQEQGVLTGEVTYMPDELERHFIQASEQLEFLRENIELIA